MNFISNQKEIILRTELICFGSGAGFDFGFVECSSSSSIFFHIMVLEFIFCPSFSSSCSKV